MSGASGQKTLNVPIIYSISIMALLDSDKVIQPILREILLCYLKLLVSLQPIFGEYD